MNARSDATAMTPDAVPDPQPPDYERPMSHWLHKPASRQDVVTIPRWTVTLVASLLVHAVALLVLLSRLPTAGPNQEALEEESSPVQVQLAEASPPPPRAAEPPPAAAPVPPPRPLPATPRRRPSPAVAMPRIEPQPSRTPAPLAPPVAAAPPVPQAKPPPQGDFLSFVQSNRRARGEPESAESDTAAADFDSKIAANLPTAAHGVAAQRPIRGGGMFEMKRMTYDDAAFEFFGWNSEMGRRTPQLIEVRKGDNANMQIAVVRRMIVIIREHEHGDFTWESGRHGSIVTLSARPADTAALENYLLHDMFDDTSDAH
jgi:hypothetical protein